MTAAERGTVTSCAATLAGLAGGPDVAALARAGIPIPKWYVVEQEVARAIQSGALAAGDPFWSEAALMVRFGVSRSVVRQALARLRYVGAIVTVPGKGALVASAAARPDPSAVAG